jgi:two-component SAPR family response regulator
MGKSIILIVSEDQTGHALALKDILERNGHVVLGPAPNCSSALEVLWREKPDLALVDTHLGSETCEAVLEECDLQDVPVVITSDSSMGTPGFLGDRDILRKPVQASAIERAIGQLSAA